MTTIGLAGHYATGLTTGESPIPSSAQRDFSEQEKNSTSPLAESAGPNPAGQLKVAVLATSSAGNSTFVSDGQTRILVDCGLSLLETTARLAAIGESVDAIDAVLLTHHHSDHCLGLETLIRRWRRGGRFVPVYCSSSTHNGMSYAIPAQWFEPIGDSSQWPVGKLDCRAFPVQHDTGQPLGFTVALGNARASFALDLGAIDEGLGDHLADSDLVLLETNHDPDMLAAGPYSYKLKTRVAWTHLSNEAACSWIASHMTHRTKHLLLGHLSVTTNDPELVRLMARRELDRLELPATLDVISPGEASGPWLLAPSLPGPDKAA
jgi:phosphoribosyl 1,2-cyclic phosphodiesterase